ncbi:MAG: UbiA family prenyltransferase [Bacteroidota bacterium]|nr:UbiA family prenyltransferase [Bacteroidota bacterium]
MGVMVTLVLRWQGFPLGDLLHLGRIGWVLVPMLVGAAGNLINDYFDVREDRINKPERALVGRTVKRRVVVVTHWGFTAAALIWSVWLSSEAGSLWPLLLVAVFSVVLYLYSPVLKGRGAWGNLAISLCVAGLVAWGGMASEDWATPNHGRSLWMLAGILGWLNFLREWVKDIQDMEGDRVAHHHTMAMRLTPLQNRNALLIGVILGGLGMLAWGTSMHLSWWRMLPTLIFFLGVVTTAIRQKSRSASAWFKALMGSLYILII